MFRIGICEDDLMQQNHLEKCIKEWADKRGQKAVVHKFISGEQFLFEYEDIPNLDLLILDIQLINMTGMDLAKEIRRKNNLVKIVFLTGVADYAIEGYEVGAVRYLLKPLKIEILEEVLDLLCEELQNRQEASFFYIKNGQTYRVPYNHIIYAEANGHYSKLITKDGIHEWKANFSVISPDFVSQGFGLLKRGLLVNLRFVNRITKNECILENGEVLPVAKSCYEELNKVFIAFYKESGW